MRRILVGSVLIMTLAMMYGFAVFYDEIVWNWRSSRIEESKRAGTLIAERIRVFALANHRLPQTLDELVPVYIKDIPNPTAGSQRWLYKVERERGSFYLRFSMPDGPPYYNYPKCTYDPDKGTWYLDE